MSVPEMARFELRPEPRMTLNRPLLRWLSLGYLLVLTLLLVVRSPSDWLRSHAQPGAWFNLLEPWTHLICFAALGVVARLARLPWSWPRQALAVTAFSVVIELVQRFIPSRRAELGDLVQNVVGFLLGLAVVALVERWQAARQARWSWSGK